MDKAVQAKHVDEGAILRVIDANLAANGPPGWTMIWDIAAVTPGIPTRVLMAKLRSMMRRGLIDGCGCGCRGDFHRPTRCVVCGAVDFRAYGTYPDWRCARCAAGIEVQP